MHSDNPSVSKNGGGRATENTPLLTTVVAEQHRQHFDHPTLTIKKIIGECIKLTAPMIISSIASTASSFFMIRNLSNALGDKVLEASALVTALEWLIPIFSIGIQPTARTAAYQTGVCENLEEDMGGLFPIKEWGELGKIYQHGLLTAGIFLIPAELLFLLSSQLFSALKYDEELIEMASPYCNIYALGLPGYFLFTHNSQFAYATKSQWTVAAIQCLSSLIGNLIGYGLINYLPGSEGERMRGMAWGIVAQYWSGALMLQAYLTFNKKYQPYKLYKHHPYDGALAKNLLLTALPTQCFLLGELSGLFMVITEANWLGDEEMAALQIALQYLAIQVLPSFRLGEAGNILVGHYLGLERVADMRRIGNTNIALGIIVECVFELLFLTMPGSLVDIFMKSKMSSMTDSNMMHTMLKTLAKNPNMQNALSRDDSQAHIRALTISSLMMVGAGQIPDSYTLIAAGNLRGLEDNAVNAAVSITMLWGVSIPSSYYLGKSLGIVGVALGRNIGLTVRAAIVGPWWHYRSHHPDNAHSLKPLIKRSLASCNPEDREEVKQRLRETYQRDSSSFWKEHRPRRLSKEQTHLQHFGINAEPSENRSRCHVM